MKSWQVRALAYALPVLAVVALILLFILALARLSGIQQDMRTNVSANMLWVVTQTQAEGLALSSALYGFSVGEVPSQSVLQQYDLLHSRLKLLSAGPQYRYLEQYGLLSGLSDLIQQALQMKPLIIQAVEGQQLARDIHTLLEPLNTQLRDVANQTMVFQWEETGERLDRYRNAVLAAIFLMMGIGACSLLISVRLFLALKRANEAQESKRHAAKLQAELESERKINELYRSFGAMVSHQFRTPLAIIDASMQRLLRMGDKVNPTEMVRRVGKVRDATQRLTRLIDNTLIADQYVDLVQVRLEKYDLGLLVSEICESQLTITPGYRIDLDIQPVQAAYCDPGLVEHVLFNFLSNAVKYSAASTAIKVRVFQEETWICCSISDQGVGVAEHHLAQVFERYFRSSQVANIQGTGIGLYVARKLALMQGGQVSAASTQGQGSVFTLRLPMTHAISG